MSSDVSPSDYSAPEDGPRLDNQLCFALYTATNAVVRSYRPLLKEIGLTYPQYLVMMALWEADDVSVTALAARLDLPLHGLSPIIERLDRAGLLSRTRDADDRRAVRIVLTETGRGLEHQAALVQHQVRCQTALNNAEVERLRVELHSVALEFGQEHTDQP